MLLEPPGLFSALMNGAVCSAIAAIVWLPLSASWRDPAGRLRRRSSAISVAAGSVMTALAVRLLAGTGPLLTPGQAVWVWLAGFLVATAAIAGAAALVTRFIIGQGWWAQVDADTQGDRKRWRLVPVVVSGFAALVLGWGYGLFAAAAAAAAAAP
ncbi:hypothetical protein [Phenylobacterium sp.]|jgi:hypothetical protein|uniref:hypothetical protein n=1 Tax=Phenylobacterium sp. TaxID=1871053 RepID=UPI002F948DE8